MSNRCLYCYRPLDDGETDFHQQCSRRFFGTTSAPSLPYAVEDLQALAKQVVRSQTTIPGVQAKLSIDLDRMSRDTKRFTIVGLWGRFILKPPTPLYPHLPELEGVTMRLAQAARIDTVPHTLIRFADGALGYLTRRIDRTPTGAKIPMEDMCQITGRLTEDKYKSSHERIAKAIEQYSSAPHLDMVKYWQQVIFAWIVGNADMHLKNFSLYDPDGDGYMLTPTYDQLSTAIVMPDDHEELALSLCGKKRKLRGQHFATAMRLTGLGEKVIDNVFKRFTASQSLWEQCVADSFLPEEMKDALSTLIDDRLRLLHDR